jgi:hypothetical protein
MPVDRNRNSPHPEPNEEHLTERGKNETLQDPGSNVPDYGRSGNSAMDSQESNRSESDVRQYKDGPATSDETGETLGTP